MPHVNVTIAGRAFRMACGEGEEERLESLAAQVDTKIAEMRSAFGEIGDQRLTVMASITFADELVELRKQLDGLRDEVAALRDAQSQIDARMKAQSSELANAVESAAERIEDITQKMNAEGKRVREADSL
jgi:cell division protein ZapA